jgi:hypothetical protein
MEEKLAFSFSIKLHLPFSSLDCVPFFEPSFVANSTDVFYSCSLVRIPKTLAVFDLFDVCAASIAVAPIEDLKFAFDEKRTTFLFWLAVHRSLQSFESKNPRRCFDRQMHRMQRHIGEGVNRFWRSTITRICT